MLIARTDDRSFEDRRNQTEEASLAPETHPLGQGSVRSRLDFSGRNSDDSLERLRGGIALMSVSSKCYYALRAVYALADHAGPEPLKIAEIAEREQIPIRFLEVILNQLKGGGFVQSRRGAEGGYRLARPADQLTVGEIMRYIDGPIAPVDCVSQTRPKVCEFPGGCHFYSFWARVRQAISDVVDKTTFADLIRESHERGSTHVGDWII